jgi:hypothetical protein
VANETVEGKAPPAEYTDMYQSFQDILLNPAKRDLWKTIPEEWGRISPGAKTFVTAVHKIQFARFCITKAGFFGLVPHATQVGDIIYTFQGDHQADTFILRKHNEKYHYTWVGLAYILGISKIGQVLAGESRLCEITVG